MMNLHLNSQQWCFLKHFSTLLNQTPEALAKEVLEQFLNDAKKKWDKTVPHAFGLCDLAQEKVQQALGSYEFYAQISLPGVL